MISYVISISVISYQLCFHLTEVINHISILPHVKSISNVRSTHALALELEFVKW